MVEQTIGRCISCGFLALHRSNFGQYLEVDPADRTHPEGLYQLPTLHKEPPPKGDWRLVPPFPEVFIESYLACYLRKADLLEEVNVHGPRRGDPQTLVAAVKSVLERDRGCPYYLPYQVGLTPKDHLLERRVSALEEDRRAFQVALDRSSKRLMWAALILGTLLALGQLVAAFFSTPDAHGSRWLRGLWPPPPPPGMSDRV